MRIFVSIAGSVAALTMCAVSAGMNYLFLSSLGKTAFEGHVLGAASAAADILKALLPFIIAWSWQAGRYIPALAGSGAFAFIAAFSLLSAIGFAADNRGVLIDARDSVAAEYNRIQRDLANAEARRAALPIHRPATVVSEEIGAHRQNRRWSATTGCANATENESRKFCAAYFRLRAELAAATESERLAGEIASLQREGESLRANGATQDSDPQVSLLSRISGAAPESVRLALIVTVALLVEIGASLGLFLASGHGRDVTQAAPLQKEAKPIGSVEDFCLEALTASPRSTLAMDDLLAGYQAWCARMGLEPLESSSFEAAFTAIADEIGLRSDPAGYRGIALCAAKNQALAA